MSFQRRSREQSVASGWVDEHACNNLILSTLTQAKALADKGAVFVDIRTPKDFAKEHIPGAVNVPMFVPVAGTQMFDQIKKFVMTTAFAMTATGACCHLPLLAVCNRATTIVAAATGEPSR